MSNRKPINLRRGKIIQGAALAAVLLTAAYLRLFRISEYMTFLGDEGRDVLVVKRMIVDHKFTLLGPTASVGGFFLGPVYYYFMMPFLWLWRLDPAGPAVMVALFGIATVYLVYRLGREMFSDFAGFAGACLYALSPLVISYSRSSWNPNIVPFFATSLAYLLYRITGAARTGYFFLLGIILGIGVQLHYLFGFLYLTTAVWLWVIRRRQPFGIRHLSALAGGWVIGISLFLAFELRHSFPNTRSIIRFLLTGNETGFTALTFAGNLADVSYRLFGRLVLWLPDRYRLESLAAYQSLAWTGGTWVLAVIGIGVLGIAANRYLRSGTEGRGAGGQAQMPAAMLFVWFLTVVVMFGFYRREIYDYYLGIMFTLPFLTTGYLLSRIYIRTKILAVIALTILVILNVWGNPFRHQPNNQLEQTKRIARTALELTGGQSFNFALVATHNSDHAYRYFFEIWGNTPVTIEPLTADPDRRTVTDQLVVICEYAECNLMGHSQWEIAGFGQAEITDQRRVPFVTIYRLVHYAEK
ncbi:hypothetical protein A2Z33_02860 [Candidatus Gottesmanbacteria bacterium RBG_16_52_11]|uniref:Glycosyltransferase RgtA/B/C/D-like domain-containing protein n=1 Tax=Candidatus Gottesmanbacteria bacterium RBG_16_52_11 TaxID=1798374 RepID=A0A1F5YMP1_9BACT|nr:MAG: hypothetical protein A2Z33_02860 [Candidatus Gottesmanbacteria bacterium RBG_16_52_11]